MSETEESTTRWPVLRALLQVGAAGGIGALALPYGFTSYVIAGWASGGGAALGVGVLFVAVVTALLVGAASLVPEASGLTRTMGGRVGGTDRGCGGYHRLVLRILGVHRG